MAWPGLYLAEAELPDLVRIKQFSSFPSQGKGGGSRLPFVLLQCPPDHGILRDAVQELILQGEGKQLVANAHCNIPGNAGVWDTLSGLRFYSNPVNMAEVLVLLQFKAPLPEGMSCEAQTRQGGVGGRGGRGHGGFGRVWGCLGEWLDCWVTFQERGSRRLCFCTSLGTAARRIMLKLAEQLVEGLSRPYAKFGGDRTAFGGATPNAAIASCCGAAWYEKFLTPH